MTTTLWAPYRPSKAEPWNMERAWTLRRRAGFGATWAELDRDLADGPEKAVDRIIAGSCRIDGVPADFATTADLLGNAAAGASDIHRLQAWWLYRMLFTPDPLLERAVLMAHDHFATSQLKVDDVSAMHRQNETFRRLGRGPFGDLLREMLHDPALLVWLDAPSNLKGKPNENLARELLELFTLGVGRFSESDVKNTARALTGLNVSQGEYQLRGANHDDGDKTILGKSDKFNADTLADHLLAQPAIANRLAWRLCATFLGEGVVDAPALVELADRLRKDNLHLGQGIETILRSRLFFSSRNLHAKVIDPVGFAIGSLRALEQIAPPPSTLLLAEWTTRMGQDLFFPPNVGGWPGGRSWLSGRSIVARANFADALTARRLHTEPVAPDFFGFVKKHRSVAKAEDAIPFLAELLTGRRTSDAGSTAKAIWSAAKRSGSDRDALNRGVSFLLAGPEAQLC